MNAWLHFSRGDYLLFQAWRPSSNGAIIGANIAVFTFSILERWLASWRRFQERRWRTRACALVLKNWPVSSSPTTPAAEGGALEGSGEVVAEVPASNQTEQPDVRRATPRLVPPFIPLHDIPRGILHAIQTAFSHILMLVIMTFNAGYIISVILGLGVGEIMFGCMERMHDASIAI